MMLAMSTILRSPRWVGALLCAAGLLAVAPVSAGQEQCFERLDNGVDMTGWQKSASNPHGPGDGWTIEDGAFVGRQTAGQQGGILMTDASYRDVEVIFEVQIDWGCDSGFFFRTTEGSRAYQVTIDHLADSGVGSIWGEGFSPELREIPYFLTDNGNAAVVAPNQSEVPIFDLAAWPTIWDPTAFNEIRARIEGNPPHVQVWISGTKVMDFTDDAVRTDVDESGPLAIQVHSGSRFTEGGKVAFKNIRARDLSVTCEDPGTAGAGGMSGAAGASSGGATSGGQGGAGGHVAGAGGAGSDAGGAAGASPVAGAGGAGQGGGLAGNASGGEPVTGGAGLGGASTVAGSGGTSGGGTAAGATSGGATSGGAMGGADSPPAADDGADGACGCRVPGGEREHGWLPALLMVLAAATGVVRRRQQRFSAF
jgi:hypothetical protein